MELVACYLETEAHIHSDNLRVPDGQTQQVPEKGVDVWVVGG